MLTPRSAFEYSVINLQVIASSYFLKIFSYDVFYIENVISIIGAQPVEIYSGCNFFMHLHKFLFFFISYPSSLKKRFKYITLCLIFLFFIQILRIASFTMCLKYSPGLWDIFHHGSSYIFYYPGIIALWYFFSSNPNASIQNFIGLISKYFSRILLFFVFYHALIRPLQINVANYFAKPLIEKKIVNEKYFELKVDQHHLKIVHRSDEVSVLHFSIPFGQAYFFIMFFLWFKPKNLMILISVYNLALIPLYALAINFFLNGYFIFGDLITLNEKLYRLLYVLIFMIEIIRKIQINLLFNDQKKITFFHRFFKI